MAGGGIHGRTEQQKAEPFVPAETEVPGEWAELIADARKAAAQSPEIDEVLGAPKARESASALARCSSRARPPRPWRSSRSSRRALR